MSPSRWCLGSVVLPGGQPLAVALGRDPDRVLAEAWHWAGRRLGQARPEVRLEPVIMRRMADGHPGDRAMNPQHAAAAPPVFFSAWVRLNRKESWRRVTRGRATKGLALNEALAYLRDAGHRHGDVRVIPDAERPDAGGAGFRANGGQ